MVVKKGSKGGTGGEDADEELTRVPLQAILLADSFATLFRPITLERPKVLLPLVNAPMIDYTLSWLESAGVEEVFVFCCAHSKQVIDYLENLRWLDQPNYSVTTIESHNSTSAGDALRLIYEKHVRSGDMLRQEINMEEKSDDEDVETAVDVEERIEEEDPSSVPLGFEDTFIASLGSWLRLGGETRIEALHGLSVTKEGCTTLLSI
ncbi:hypothetical protein OROGR_021130 [Orobanche gracilis]